MSEPSREPDAAESTLTDETTLDDLFKAILGVDAVDVDDNAELLAAVDTQVRDLRNELGLPEPAPVAIAAESPRDTMREDSIETAPTQSATASSSGGRGRTMLRQVATFAANRIGR